MTKQLIRASILAALLASPAGFAADSQIRSDKQAVDQACAAEAKAANCGTEQVGTGLLRCIHAYRKANPSFQLSPGCEAAARQLRMDEKARRAAKQQQPPPSPPPGT